jgi:endonuclease-8
MPEGDTLFRAAATLRKALLGKRLTGFETDVETVRNRIEGLALVGREITLVEARGKHLLIRLGAEDEGSLTLRTHLRMKGSWHIYRPGETWRKPVHYARVVLRTDDFVAVCFSAPEVELLTERQVARHPDLSRLGPDAITDEFNAEEAFARLRRRPELPIGVGLLNQRALSGVGNVYKSEVMFLKRVSPFLLIRELSDEVLMGLVQESHRLLQLNQTGGRRRTHFSLSEHARLWVYGRSGEPCRVCETRVKMRRQGLDGRSTYYCPRCQGVESE